MIADSCLYISLTISRVQPEGNVPYFTSDHWTGELEGLWTVTDTRTAADTAIDMDSVYGTVM